MNVTFSLFEANDNESYLWTREVGEAVRTKLFNVLKERQTGDVVVVDFTGIKAFDYSFANELFGKTLMRMPAEFPNNFLVVTNLNDYTRENLINALSSLPFVIVERKQSGELVLLGKAHPVDELTFDAICHSTSPLTANDLAKTLNVKVQAMNERLSKLVEMRVIRRSNSLSQAGREQFEYSKLL
jgi:hypothetical protein